MNRYEVEVKVTYHITAPSYGAAFRAIRDGAEFPVVPWDDETYVSNVVISRMTELSHANIPAHS